MKAAGLDEPNALLKENAAVELLRLPRRHRLSADCCAADAACDPLGMVESTLGYHFPTTVMKVENEASKASESGAFF